MFFCLLLSGVLPPPPLIVVQPLKKTLFMYAFPYSFKNSPIKFCWRAIFNLVIFFFFIMNVTIPKVVHKILRPNAFKLLPEIVNSIKYTLHFYLTNVCLSSFLSVCHLVCMSFWQFVFMSLSMTLYTYLPTYLCILYVGLNICSRLSVGLFINSVRPSVCLSVPV